jgi:hypothetical protein
MIPNGAQQFMRNCLSETKAQLHGAVLESQMDSAFFSFVRKEPGNSTKAC